SRMVSVATAPVAVRIARSAPADSATVIPVGTPGRTATKDVSTPAAASWPSMNRPAGSSPTAAASATRSPSRAAATAVIEADPPTTLGPARGHHPRGRPPRHQPADARLALVVRHGPGHRVDPIPPEERDVQGDLLKDSSGQRAGQLVGLWPGHPAGSHDLDVLA